MARFRALFREPGQQQKRVDAQERELRGLQGRIQALRNERDMIQRPPTGAK